MNQLPECWKAAPLGEITDYGAAKQVRPDEIGLESWVLELEDVEKDTSKLLQRVKLKERKSKSNKSKFGPGDVLYGKLRPYLNKVILADDSGYCTTEIIPITPASGIEPRWIFYALKHPAFIQHVAALCRGINMPRLTTEDARSVEIAVPPTNEQRRIVAKLDALFEKSRLIREKLDRLPRLLANLQKSILNSAFSGDLTREWRANNPNVEPASELLKRIRAERRAKWEADLIAKGKDPKKAKYVEPEPVDTEGLPELPEGWCWASMPELGELGRGKSKHRPRNDPRLFGNKVPFIQTGEVAQSGGMLSTYSKMYSEFGVQQSKIWPVGTVCITIAANIADSTILGMDACFPDSVVGFLPDTRLVSSEYIEYFIRSSRDDLKRFAPATAQANINLEVLGEVAVPLPPFDEMHEITRKLQLALFGATKIAEQMETMEVKVAKAESSLLKKAFRGELVPQDPNDEPASVLLERIRAQKPAPGTKRGRGRKAAA